MTVFMYQLLVNMNGVIMIDSPGHQLPRRQHAAIHIFV